VRLNFQLTFGSQSWKGHRARLLRGVLVLREASLIRVREQVDSVLGCFLWQRKEPPRQPIISFWQKPVCVQYTQIWHGFVMFGDVWCGVLMCERKVNPQVQKVAHLSLCRFQLIIQLVRVARKQDKSVVRMYI